MMSFISNLLKMRWALCRRLEIVSPPYRQYQGSINIRLWRGGRGDDIV